MHKKCGVSSVEHTEPSPRTRPWSVSTISCSWWRTGSRASLAWTTPADSRPSSSMSSRSTRPPTWKRPTMDSRSPNTHTASRSCCKTHTRQFHGLTKAPRRFFPLCFSLLRSAKAANPNANVPQLMEQFETFLANCQAAKTLPRNLDSHMVYALCAHITDRLIQDKTARLGIAAMQLAISILSDKPNQLTEVHYLLLKVCTCLLKNRFELKVCVNRVCFAPSLVALSGEQALQTGSGGLRIEPLRSDTHGKSKLHPFDSFMVHLR